MRRRMQKIDVEVGEWSEAFQQAIETEDIIGIKDLLSRLPDKFETVEQMKRILLQTIEAEQVLGDIREQFVKERERLLSISHV